MSLERIYLVRHGESLGNVKLRNHKIYPDHGLPLSLLGFWQGQQAGLFLAQHFAELEKKLGRKLKIRLWVSPYKRTRKTAKELLMHSAAYLGTPREDTMLVEQQFGLFDGLTDKECAERFPNEWYTYQHTLKCQGKFWARKPGGESPFDVDVRARQMQGTWGRDADKHGVNTVVVVSHGTTCRVIAMRYLRQSSEDYHEEPNPRNCAIRLLEKVGGKWVDRGYINI